MTELTLATALQIVIDLAKSSALDTEDNDPMLSEQAERQHAAINMVEDLAVNEYGDD